MYRIVEKYKEPTGRWCVRAVISDDEAAFLWFEVEPDQASVDAAVANQLRQRALMMPVVEVVVMKCSAWQIRKVLNLLGLRAAVEAVVANSTNQDLKDGWNHSPQFFRYEPLTVQMGRAMGKTDAEMDALFELAKTL